MAVNHCRCAFLSFFLLHKQKKEHNTYSNSSYLLFAHDESGQALMQMGNPQDCEKKIIRLRRTAGWVSSLKIVR
jgi:hypothetical protein